MLVVISVMTGVAIARFPSFSFDEDFNRETDRVRLVLEQLREEATLSSTEYGFKPDETGYSFHMYNEFEQSWVQTTQSPFGEHPMPESIELDLTVEESEFQLGGDEETVPPVLVLSSGEVTPFRLRMRRSDGLVRTLVSDGYARLDWEGEQ